MVTTPGSPAIEKNPSFRHELLKFKVFAANEHILHNLFGWQA